MAINQTQNINSENDYNTVTEASQVTETTASEEILLAEAVSEQEALEAVPAEYLEEVEEVVAEEPACEEVLPTTENILDDDLEGKTLFNLDESFVKELDGLY